MGALTSLLAVSGKAMDTADWQVRAGAWLQHVAAVVLDALSWLPGWAGALLVFGALGLIVTVAVRQSAGSRRTGATARPSDDARNETADDDAAALTPSSPATTPHPMEIP
jgi:hypothetical protein